MGEMLSHDGTGGGYLAAPEAVRDADGIVAAVIVVAESWRLVPHITTVADRFAEAGFLAFAPALRRDTAGHDDSDVPVTGPALESAGREVAVAADHLLSRPGTTGRVGCVGFGAGGSLALWAATRSKQIVAAAAFYPVLPWERMPARWPEYAGKAALIHRSEDDLAPGTTTGGTGAASGIEAVRRAIEEGGGECDVNAYPGTRRGFFNDDRPNLFDRPAATSSWARTLEFLRSRLG